MINVSFFLSDNGDVTGYELKGHATHRKTAGHDIICASVSSAAYMAANTVTDVLMLSPELNVSDGYMFLNLTDGISEAQTVLKGLRLHLEALAADYPHNIKVTSIRRCQNA